MGERKQKQTRNARHIKKHPFCIYCGGKTKGTEVDHVPPIALFTNKKRPQGMEFTTCHECHLGTRKLDTVASYYSRLLATPNSSLDTDYTKKLIKGIYQNIPLIADELEEMHRGASCVNIKKSNETAYLSTFGPLSKNAIEAFAARLGLALHYEKTGEILPSSGVVSVKIYTNVQAMKNEIPAQIFSAFKNPSALKQKGLKAHEDFSFETQGNNNETMSFACFRNSFAILVGCCKDNSRLDPKLITHSYRPSFLIDYKI